MYRMCCYQTRGSCEGAWGGLRGEKKDYEKSNIKKKKKQKTAIQNKNLSNFFRAT